MIERDHCNNCSGKFIHTSQKIILISLTISLIFCIIDEIIFDHFKGFAIVNFISIVFFIITLFIGLNYNDTGKNCLKFISNAICLIISGYCLGMIFFFGMSFCTFGCTRGHPLNILHGLTFLYMFLIAIIYLIIGIKLKIESICRNNEQHFVQDNDNTIVTPD